jgi:hypothetical protein
MKKSIAARSAFIAASAAIVAFKAEGAQTDFDVICAGLTAAFEKCECTTNPTSAVGYVIDTAFVGCIRPEIEVDVNFTGSERYLSSISVSQDSLSFRHVDLMMDANHTVTSCQATSYGRECECTVCSTPEAGVALDIDCNGNFWWRGSLNKWNLLHASRLVSVLVYCLNGWAYIRRCQR